MEERAATGRKNSKLHLS